MEKCFYDSQIYVKTLTLRSNVYCALTSFQDFKYFDAVIMIFQIYTLFFFP